MKINLKNFETLLRKATVNFSIETLQLRFGEKIKSYMISGDGNTISILKVDNNVLDTNEELVFNFIEPSQNVMPFINLFEGEESQFSVTDAFMKLKQGNQSAKVSFCNDTAVKRFGTDHVKQDVEWFFEFTIDEDFMIMFEKIKKIGSRFGKVYLDVNDKRVFLETADKTNTYSNGLRFQLSEIDYENITLCFDYKNFCNLMAILDLENNFKGKFTYSHEQELGMFYVYSDDDTEKYALLSREL